MGGEGPVGGAGETIVLGLGSGNEEGGGEGPAGEEDGGEPPDEEDGSGEKAVARTVAKASRF